MANTRTKWTPEMLDRLHELRARNFTPLEIAQDMGLTFEAVQNRIKYESALKTGQKPKPKKPRERFKLAETPEQPQPQKPASDPVNHPSHYTAGGVECIDAIRAATTGLVGFEAYCTGTIVKYVWRWKRKNGLEDLKKAEVYLHWLIAEVSKDA